MSLTEDQIKKIELTVDDGRLDCVRDVNGEYSCTMVRPIKQITGVCTDDQTNVTVTGRVNPNVPAPIYTFEVCGRNYEYTEGMTWTTWISSAHNTTGVYTDPSGCTSCIYFGGSSGTEINTPFDTTLIENKTYTCSTNMPI